MGVQGLQTYIKEKIVQAQQAGDVAPMEVSLAECLAWFKLSPDAQHSDAPPRLLIKMAAITHEIAHQIITLPAHACLASVDWMHTRLDRIQRALLAAGVEPVWYIEASSPTDEKEATLVERLKGRISKNMLGVMAHLHGDGPAPRAEDLLYPNSTARQAALTLEALEATMITCVGDADFAMLRAFDARRDLAILSQDSDLFLCGTPYIPLHELRGLLDPAPRPETIRFIVFRPSAVHALLDLPAASDPRALLALSTLVGNDFTRPLFEAHPALLRDVLGLGAPPHGKGRIASVCAYLRTLRAPLQDTLAAARARGLSGSQAAGLDQLITAHTTLLSLVTPGAGMPDLGPAGGFSYAAWCAMVVARTVPMDTLRLVYQHRDSLHLGYELDHPALPSLGSVILPLLAATWRLLGHDQPVVVLRRDGATAIEETHNPRALAPAVPCLAGFTWPLTLPRADCLKIFWTLFQGFSELQAGPPAGVQVTRDTLPTLAAAYYAHAAAHTASRPLHRAAVIAMLVSSLPSLPAAPLPAAATPVHALTVSLYEVFTQTHTKLAAIALMLGLCSTEREPRSVCRGALFQDLLFTLLRTDPDASALPALLAGKLTAMGMLTPPVRTQLDANLALFSALCPDSLFELPPAAVKLWGATATALVPGTFTLRLGRRLEARVTAPCLQAELQARVAALVAVGGQWEGSVPATVLGPGFVLKSAEGEVVTLDNEARLLGPASSGGHVVLRVYVNRECRPSAGRPPCTHGPSCFFRHDEQPASSHHPGHRSGPDTTRSIDGLTHDMAGLSFRGGSAHARAPAAGADRSDARSAHRGAPRHHAAASASAHRLAAADWSCYWCTFINSATARACGACLRPRSAAS
eukprot:m.4778 g.4778  ORF g.4778 m.4778 type:complete len:866 (+) comp4389_c0_seq2:251-2848(+)